MKPILLLDTYSLFFRAHHALPPMNTSGGEPTSAMYGLSTLLLKLFRERSPSGVSFALDAPARTFRHAEFSEYKSNRERAPDPLVAQFPRLHQLIGALGVPSFCVPGFEADDVLATLAGALSQTDPVLVVSGDRDLLQLVTAEVSVLFVGRRGKDALLFDEEQVQKRFGVSAKRLPLLTALSGDSSDNLPQVPGVGAKTAAKLAAQFDCADALLANLDQVTPMKLRDVLREHADQIRRTESLARLRRDVPLPAGPRFAPLSDAGLLRASELFAELEFRSLLPRVGALRETLGGS